MKKCPYCAEEIKSEAIICRYCNNSLTGKTNKNSKVEDKKLIKKTDDILIRVFKVTGLLIVIFWIYGNNLKLSQNPYPELQNEIKDSEIRLEKLRKAFEE